MKRGQHKNLKTKTFHWRANHHAHMKNTPVQCLPSRMQRICRTLQHALVNHAQVNLFWRAAIFNMLSCPAIEETTTAMTFMFVEDIQTSMLKTSVARSSNFWRFSKLDLKAFQEQRMLNTSSFIQTRIVSRSDCIRKLNIRGATNPYVSQFTLRCVTKKQATVSNPARLLIHEDLQPCPETLQGFKATAR